MAGTSFSRYFIVFMLIVAMFLFLPLPIDYAKTFIRASASSGAKIMMFGASTIDETSKCDSDSRSIAQMLAAQTGWAVTDASRNGITVEGEINVAAVIAKIRQTDTFIITANWNDLLESDAISLHDYITFRELNPELAFDSPLAYYHGIDSLFAATEKRSQPFVYHSHLYPGSVAGLFEAEAASRTCPENDGHDAQGIAATYFHAMVEHGPEQSLARLITSFTNHLEQEHKSAVFVLLPLNFDRLGQMDPSWPALIRHRRDEFLVSLRSGRVPVLDLSEDLQNDAFIDRWCGCSHFSQAGRMFVANQLARFLSTMVVSAGQDL